MSTRGATPGGFSVRLAGNRSVVRADPPPTLDPIRGVDR